MALLIVGRPSPRGCLVGVVFVLVGQAIRFWSAGYIVKSAELTTGGPFAWVRNPLYFGSLLIACGYCTMTGGWIVWVVIVPLFFAVHGSAVMQEERFLRSKYKEAFDDYCRRVPRWIPRIPKSRAEVGVGISIEQIKRNKEHKWCLASLAVIVIFGLKLLFWS